ncbi:inositol phosphorylceramide glucuronosyltransferase 1 [Tanacetum coccineum]
MGYVHLIRTSDTSDQGFLNAYYAGFPSSRGFDQNISPKEMNSRPIADMERLSMLYNVDVVLYLLADKLEGMNKARAIHLDAFVNTPLYVVHVMSTDVMEEIARAQRSGQRVIVEPVVCHEPPNKSIKARENSSSNIVNRSSKAWSPSNPQPHVNELFIATAYFKRNLESWNISHVALTSLKELVYKETVLHVQHRVLSQFEIPLVGLVEVQGYVQEIHDILFAYTSGLGTDNAKIIRKRSKLDKHGHGKGKRIQEPGECYQSTPIGQSPQDSTRGIWKKHTNQVGFVLKCSQKKHKCSDTRNATLAIRVLTKLIQWTRIKIK